MVEKNKVKQEKNGGEENEKRKIPQVNINWDESSPKGIRPEYVIQACIERVKYLDDLLDCYENKRVLRHLEMALLWEERRNKRRKDQGVQGKMIKHTRTHGHDQESEDYERGLRIYKSFQ